ncbi:RNase H family protein [Streptomyces sp. NPDC001093]|uniref:RNase H family protein n=1 Tax=Streptomyces sp. NPDC001093 TaxID=3154376 RepID=UPI0033286176
MPKPLKRQIALAGTVPSRHTTGTVLVATDAAVDDARAGGGYLATSGHYGARAHPYPRDISGPSRSTVAELRAILWALQAVTASVGSSRPVTVLTDSADALGYLTAWQAGGTRMPDGYRVSWRSSDRQPTLVELQQMAEYTPGLTFTHVKGHVGHPLNEAADSLAKLALRCSKGVVDRGRAAELAPEWAQQNLKAWRAQAADA